MFSKIVGFLGAWYIAGLTSSYWDKQYNKGLCRGRAAKRFMQEREESKEAESQKTEG